MNRVSACCEFFAEFRSDDTAAAVGRIYRDADVHWCFLFSTLLVLSLQSTKHKAQSTTDKKLRQATLAIACLYLNLTHLLRGGASEGGSIKPVWEFSNDSCNEVDVVSGQSVLAVFFCIICLRKPV